ncbi:MAG: hypothetical protein AABW49_03840 [Nanoarchaeota archaeon]
MTSYETNSKVDPAGSNEGYKMCVSGYHINEGPNTICATPGCKSDTFSTKGISELEKGWEIGLDGVRQHTGLVDRLVEQRLAEKPLSFNDLILLLRICGVLYGPKILSQEN